MIIFKKIFKNLRRNYTIYTFTYDDEDNVVFDSYKEDTETKPPIPYKQCIDNMSMEHLFLLARPENTSTTIKEEGEFPEKLMDYLLTKDENTRGSIAERPDLPLSIIKKLANDPVSEVREDLADNMKIELPENIVKQLEKDEDPYVREAALGRNLDNFDEEDGTYLKKDFKYEELIKNKEIFKDFINNTEVSNDSINKILKNASNEIVLYYVKNKNITEDNYKNILNNKNITDNEKNIIKKRISEKETLPEFIIYDLLKTKDKEIKENLAKNKKLPEPVIIILNCDRNSRVVYYVKNKLKNIKIENMEEMEKIYNLLKDNAKQLSDIRIINTLTVLKENNKKFENILNTIIESVEE